jgi:hypothetical protein
MPHGIARLSQRLAKEFKVAIGQFERKPHSHDACPEPVKA